MTKYTKQIVLGYDANGKQIRKRIYADGKRDLERKIAEIRDAQKAVRHPSGISFGAYSDKWLEVYKAKRSVNTRNMYRYALNQCSDLTATPIKDVTKTDLQAIIAAHADKPRFCQQIKLTLKQVFSAAIEDGIISYNPASALELPKYKAKEKRALTDTERKAIREAELPEEDRLFLDLLYYCGLRRGEALALTRSDFDFKTLLLRICKSVAYNGNKPSVKDTKTHVTRYVPIPEAMADKWKAVLSNRPFVIFTENDNYYSNSFFRKKWLSIASAVGLPDLTPHMIRHDYATRLYYVPGISTKKKASILGHQETLFLKLYSHLENEKEDMKIFQKAMTF